MVRRPLFSFQQAQFVQVSPLKPAPFSMLSAGLDSTDKSGISLPFSFYLTVVLSSPLYPLFRLSFCINLSGRSGRNCLLSLPVLSGYNEFPDARFSRGTTLLISWSDGEGYLCPVQSLVVYFLSFPLSIFVIPQMEAYCLI